MYEFIGGNKRIVLSNQTVEKLILQIAQIILLFTLIIGYD